MAPRTPGNPGVHAAVLLLLAAGLCPGTLLAEGTPISDPVDFELAQPEGLFGPGAPENEDVIPIDVFSEHKGPVTQGEIVRVSQDVPVAVLQDVWNTALQTCTAYDYTVVLPTPCGNVTISPTQSECITGHIGNRTVGTRCCVNPTLKYPSCDFFGSVGGSRTVNVNRQLPVAIGPYPTQPLPKDVDIGARVTYQADVDVGMEVSLRQNAGLVDVAYGTDVVITPSADSALPGEVVRLTGRHVPDGSRTHMSSVYPSLDLTYRYFYKADASIDLQYAHMDGFGNQTSGSSRILDFSTADSPHADNQGRVVGEFISVEIGTGGAEVAFMRNVPYAPAATQDRIFQFPLVFQWDVTSPFTCPFVPILSGLACPPPPPLSWDLFEVGIRTPEVNTPVDAGFDGGVGGFAGTAVPVLRNALGPDGSLTNTAPSAWRPLVAGLLGDFSDIDFADILTTDAALSADFARLDFDMDSLIGLAVGVPPPASPFGVNFSIPTTGIDPATGLKPPTPPLVIEANALDIDLVNWFSIDQSLVFRPNLMAVLNFSKPTAVRLQPTDPWQQVTQFEWALYADADSSLEIQMPEGGVNITPTYTLRNNLFTNDTRWYYTPGWQTSWLQLKIQGFIATFLDVALGFDPNFALSQSTLSPGPIQMGTTGSTSYTFDQFTDRAGSRITLAAAVPVDTDGDGVADHQDNCRLAPNAGQQDADSDGFGNVCDADMDNSGFVNAADLAAFRLAFGTPNALADFDSSGFVNAGDLARFRLMFGKPPGPGPSGN